MTHKAGVLAAVLLLGMLLGAGGWLLGSRPSAAQGEAVPVSAVATDWVTDFEQDPFENNFVRRSTVHVNRIAVLYSDGKTEMQDIRK